MQNDGNGQDKGDQSQAHAHDHFFEDLPLTGNVIRDKRIRRFLAAMVETKGVITMACTRAGVGRNTVYEWRKQFDWFNDEVEKYQVDYRGEWLENQLFTLCSMGEVKAIMFALENKKLAKFGYADTAQVREEKPLTDAQIALLKRAGINVVKENVEAQGREREGRTGYLAIPAPGKSLPLH